MSLSTAFKNYVSSDGVLCFTGGKLVLAVFRMFLGLSLLSVSSLVCSELAQYSIHNMVLLNLLKTLQTSSDVLKLI